MKRKTCQNIAIEQLEADVVLRQQPQPYSGWTLGIPTYVTFIVTVSGDCPKDADEPIIREANP